MYKNIGFFLIETASRVIHLNFLLARKSKDEKRLKTKDEKRLMLVKQISRVNFNRVEDRLTLSPVRMKGQEQI